MLAEDLENFVVATNGLVIVFSLRVVNRIWIVPVIQVFELST
jgi:hypothetical protein